MKLKFEFELPAIVSDMIIGGANDAISEMGKPEIDFNKPSLIRVDTQGKQQLLLECLACFISQTFQDSDLYDHAKLKNYE